MKGLYLPILCLLILLSCTRKDIDFGTIPENSYTDLAYIDTVTAQLSIVLTDSFATSSDTVFLLGRYKDPYLGSVAARPFLQMTVPTSVPDIPVSAVFDSLSLIIKPNDYYYGDTTKMQTITVYELAEPITHTYNDQLFNTSNIPAKSSPLGSVTLRFSPYESDSIAIRLSNSKGAELFDKLQQKATTVTDQTEFSNYFYGVSLGVADNDTSAVFGLKGTDASFVMRVHYHLTIPYPQSTFIDFTSLANEYAFTQILPDRTGTGLIPVTPGVSELFPGNTNDVSVFQPGTGMALKMIFPSLRQILNKENGATVKLLKAELIVKPKQYSYDLYQDKLPASLSLGQTDETNLLGGTLVDSTGQNALAVAPVIDYIYGINTYYRFNITNYINQLLTNTGTEKKGFYLIQQSSNARIIDRMIVDATAGKDAGVKLLLYVLNINN